MAKSQVDKTLTGLAGEFLVAGNLCLKGFLASLTLKNYPKVDVFCLNPKNGKQAAIQVKTLRGEKLYYVPEDIDGSNNPFVFVHITKDDHVEFYIVPAKVAADLSKCQREKYLRDHPNVKREQPRMLSLSSIAGFANRWDLLGLE